MTAALTGPVQAFLAGLGGFIMAMATAYTAVRARSVDKAKNVVETKTLGLQELEAAVSAQSGLIQRLSEENKDCKDEQERLRAEHASMVAELKNCSATMERQRILNRRLVAAIRGVMPDEVSDEELDHWG